MERQVQSLQHELQSAHKEAEALRTEAASLGKTLRADLKRQEQKRLEEIRAQKEKFQERVSELESELDQLKSDAQNERHSQLNKHIEQAAQLNN